MEHQQLISPDKQAVVTLLSGEYRVRLVVGLADEFTGGEVVQFSPGALVSLEGADTLAAYYTRKNWASGIMSGTLYAFRALDIPRQILVVRELSGRLRASDMDALATGSAIAIAKLVDKDLAWQPPEGWSIQTEVTERSRLIANRANPEDLATSRNLESVRSLQRLHELRSLSSAELLLLVTLDKVERELSAEDIRLIHDIATQRSEAGVEEAGVLAEVDTNQAS